MFLYTFRKPRACLTRPKAQRTFNGQKANTTINETSLQTEQTKEESSPKVSAIFSNSDLNRSFRTPRQPR